MDPITNEQRTENKTKRLKHAASHNDGSTVRLLSDDTPYGHRGRFVVVSPSVAKRLIIGGHAEHAE